MQEENSVLGYKFTELYVLSYDNNMYSTDTDISSGWLGGCWVGLSVMLVIVETDQFCLFNYGIELIYLEN